MRTIIYAILALLTASLPAGCTLLKVSLDDELRPFAERTISGEGRDKVLLIDLSGIITGQETPSPFGGKKRPGIVARVREELDRARADTSVKAVVLRINSPGGGVTASDMLYHEIRKFKQDTGAKVLAHIMDVGTSGAYYAALAADRITAQPTSVTGSIGVIMFRVDATGLMQKIGLLPEEISSGALKGMGSPFRPLSPEERGLFQEIVDSFQARFVNLVSEARKLPADAARNLADGRVFTSSQAKDSGLLDDIGYLDDAVNQAMRLAGLERASVVTYFRPGEYRANLYSVNLLAIDMGEMPQSGVSFMYVWWP